MEVLEIPVKNMDENKGQKKETLQLLAKKILNNNHRHSLSPLLKQEAISYITDLIAFLFPHFSTKKFCSTADILAKLQLLERRLIDLLKLLEKQYSGNMAVAAARFTAAVPEIHDNLWNDARAFYMEDPAAKSIDEIILAYPGFMAIMIYRISHELHIQGIPYIPRILTEYAHSITGIDINPGAVIGSPFVIDHGTGVVIGETCIIGSNVKMYQGVTLGALSVKKSLSHTKRHPTIEDDVVIYSQAVILGGETVIGKKSIIGGNAWVTKSIPPNSVVYNKIEVRLRGKENFEEGEENGNGNNNEKQNQQQ